MSKIENFRDRKFMFLLYPDNESHMKALETLIKSYDVAYILHDKDKEVDTNQLKKSHYHVIIRTGNNAKWSYPLCEELGIEPRFVEKIGKLDNALAYLIHYNEEDTIDKYKYELNEVKGNLNVRLKEIISKEDKTEGEKVIELIEIIDNADMKIKVKDFARHCASTGKWDVFRRSSSIFMAIISEHNEEIEETYNPRKIRP